MFKKIIGTIVIVGIIAVSGLMLLDEGQVEAVKEDTFKKVYVTKAEMGQVKSEFSINGYVKEDFEMIDASVVQGKIAKVLVKAGDQVTVGQPLIQLDIVGDLDNINFQSKQLSGSISEIELTRKQTIERKAKFDKLYANGAIAKDEIVNIEDQISQYNEQINRLKEQKSQLAIAKNNVSQRSLIKASCEGEIIEMTFEPGEFIGQEDHIKIKKSDTQKVLVEVTEGFLADLPAGKSVQVEIGDHKDLQGTVTKVKEGGGSALLYPVEIELSTDLSIRNGVSAKVIVPTYKNDQAVLINNRAIIKYNDESYVLLAEKGSVTKQNLELGLSQEGKVEVLSGLTTEDAVIIKGQFSVKPGERVEVLAE